MLPVSDNHRKRQRLRVTENLEGRGDGRAAEHVMNYFQRLCPMLGLRSDGFGLMGDLSIY